MSKVPGVLTRRCGASARKFRRLFLTSWIVQVESHPPALVEETIDFLAVGVETKKASYTPIIPPTDRVAGRLVFARPMFADVPLVPFEETFSFSKNSRMTMLAYVGPGHMLFFCNSVGGRCANYVYFC